MGTDGASCGSDWQRNRGPGYWPLEEAPRRQAGAFAGREPAGGARQRRAAEPGLARVTVDTTVQPKNITLPTDAKLLHAATAKLTGCEVERAYVDKSYRGHEAANPRRVFISGQKRGAFGTIRELRRRSAIEAVIGHMKNDGHLGRCYLKGRDGDAANAILTALQLPTAPRLAEDPLAPDPDRASAGASRSHQRSDRLLNGRLSRAARRHAIGSRAILGLPGNAENH